MVLDASIRNRLEKLRKSVAQRGVRRNRAPDGDQAGRDRKHSARADRGDGDATPPTSRRSAPSSPWPTASPASTASTTAWRWRCSTCRTGSPGLALNLEADNVGAVLFGEWDKIVEGDTVKRTGHLLRDPGRRGAARPHGRPARPPARQPRRGRHHRDPPGRVQSPRRRPAPAGRGTGPDRPDVDRRDDPDRPRPARADHRRPPDRQDGDRDRHDHQQQATRT